MGQNDPLQKEQDGKRSVDPIQKEQDAKRRLDRFFLPKRVDDDTLGPTGCHCILSRYQVAGDAAETSHITLGFTWEGTRDLLYHRLAEDTGRSKRAGGVRMPTRFTYVAIVFDYSNPADHVLKGPLKVDLTDPCYINHAWKIMIPP